MKEKENRNEEKPVVKTLPPSIDGPGVKCDRCQPGGTAYNHLVYLASLPKIRTRIPREGKEPIDAVHTVIVNDLRINIRKGVTVELPTDVVEIIENAFYGEQNAREKAVTINPFTGKSSNALIDMKTDAEKAGL